MVTVSTGTAEQVAFIASDHYIGTMGTAARVVGALVFVLFVSVIALRPLVSNPAIADAVRDGLGGWELFAVAPLVVVTALVVALRVRSLTDNEHEVDSDRYSVADTGTRESFWDARKAGSERAGDESSAGDHTDASGAETGEMADSQYDSTPSGEGQAQGPAVLSGQGGTRDRAFDIEGQPPDAMLSEHLDHLRAELDTDEAAQDLKTLEEVAQAAEGDRTVPARCPQPHCAAVWTGRTVFGVGTDRYELLEDGERVQCLECEAIHTLE